jgi:hypothetical protein
MSGLHKSNQPRSPEFLLKMATALTTSTVTALYAHLRWGISLFVSGGIFFAGSLLFYFSIGFTLAFVKSQLTSGNVQKAYTVKSIVYLVVVWAVFFACGQSYWTFDAPHEIGICPGWSNDVEETSYPILVKVTDRGTKEDIPISKFMEKSGERHWAPEGEGLEIRECVYYRYTDSEKLKKVSFQFAGGKEYLPVQVTANDAGAVLDMDAGGETQAKIVLTPSSGYDLTWATLFLYFARWFILIVLAVVFGLYSLILIHHTQQVLGKFFKWKGSPAQSLLILIQSMAIAGWLTQYLDLSRFLSLLTWLIITVLFYLGLGVISDRITPASEDANVLGKVVIFAFCTSIVLSVLIPLQPSGLFGIVSPATISNVLYNFRLLGKIAVFDLILWALFTLLTDTQKIYPPKPTLSRRWIVLYALPMMVVGFAMLLAFWPGVMNQDSLDQWGQVTAFEFDLANPIFHTLLNWLITRVWLSPAAVVTAQILGLSLTAGYALYRLEKAGLPKFVIATAAVIAALVPPNAFYVVMLCKDIPYAITFLWLTVFMFEIFYSNGRWIMNNKNTLILGITVTCAALLRYNGLFEMIALIILLLVIYRKTWRRWILISVSAVILMSFANFSFDRYLPKPAVFHGKSIEGAGARIIDHRIRAHIYSGTEIQQSERDLLSTALPSMAIFDKYNCHDAPFYQLSYDALLIDPENLDELMRGYLPLIFRSPWVEVRHQICNLSLFYRVYPQADEFQELVPIRIHPESGELIYQVTPEYAQLVGVSQDSKIPSLARVLGEYVTKMVRDKSLLSAPWRVAPYIYIIIVGLIFRGSIYERNWRFLIIGGPVLVHLAVFTFGNLFSILRFHYIIIPVASILWPVLFLRGRIQPAASVVSNQ